MKKNRTCFNCFHIEITKLLWLGLLVVFICSSFFFAINLKSVIIPDESRHFQLTKLFSTTWGLPSETVDTIPFGGVTYQPFLFYWVSARIINFAELIVSGLNEGTELLILRFTNIIYSTISVIFCFLLAKEIINNRWAQLFVVFLLTNTLMFTFLSSGYNYDNLLNLFCFAGIYYLVRVLKGKSFYGNSTLWLTCILLGSLVKVTMLPLASITGLFWILYVFRKRKEINFRFAFNFPTIIIMFLLTSLLAANVVIYGGSFLHYHTLQPSCENKFTVEQCEDNELFVRNQELRLDEKLTLAAVIGSGYPDPVIYALDIWPTLMLQRIYGILGHRIYYPNITVFRILILWGIIVIVRYWRKPTYFLGSLQIVLLFYLIVLFLKNYNTELNYGFKHVAIQGRYLFPVIGVFYTLLVYYYCKIPSKLIRLLTFEITTIVFLFYSPIVFLLRFYNAGLSEWFM